MEKTLEFPDLLRLIDDRSTAFREVIAAAPDLEAQVPTCPEWTLRDLVAHLGGVHRHWAGIVLAGSSDTPPPDETSEAASAPSERADLVAWSAESTQQLLDALRENGPDRGCRTWWDSPKTTGAVARHQVQEASVHTYDAQVTLGAPQPLPVEAALDGVEEFLSTSCTTTSPWPHAPAELDFRAAEGRAWRLTLSADGARVARIDGPAADLPAAVFAGTASELVLTLYGRNSFDAVQISGDHSLPRQLRDWDPEA